MSSVVIQGDSSGSVTLQAPAAAGSVTVTLPATSGTMAVTGASQSFTDITATGNLTVNGNTTLGDASTDTILMTGAPSIGGAGYGMGMGFRNRIINGGMDISQRGTASFTVPATTTTYTADRWNAYATQASKFTVQQTPSATETGYATRVGAGFTNYLACTSSAATSVGASDYYVVNQRIEGLNMSDLAWGTANAKTVTLSAWVYSSLTGTFGGAIQNNGQDRSYPFSFTISSANTWTQISVTITGDTSGTWLTTNGIGMRVFFNLGSGSTYSGTSGAWAGAAYFAPTSAVQTVATNGATFYITGVQLEKGSTATSFDYRPYGTELQLCQRYYWRFTNTTAGIIPVANLQAYNTTSAYGKFFDLPVVMRATPTGNNGGAVQPTNAGGSPQTAFTGGNVNATTASLYTGAYTGSTGLVAGNSTVVYLAVSGWFDASAEL